MAKINVPSDVREAAAALGEPKPMRRGSLTDHFYRGPTEADLMVALSHCRPA